MTAQAQASSGVDCWGLSFGNGTNAADDPLGNLLNMSVAKCSGPSLSLSVNTSNRITNTGFSYDTAGNNTADGSYTYIYDAENRITSAAGVNYSYDGNSLRVKKSSGTLYWRSIWGDTIAESDLTGSTTNSNYHEYIFFAGRRIARSDPSASAVYYYFVDQLGSTRTVTQSNGTVCFSADYYPYGQELDYNTTCPQNYKFTGYERDPETGLDYAFNRYYNTRLGRFMSADPLAGSAADPQSLNRYTYVRNDPGNLVDPSGLCFMVLHGGEGEYVWADWILCNFRERIIRGWLGDGRDGGGGSSIGPTPKPTQKPPSCVEPTTFQKVGIAAQAAVARLTGKTIGVGLGGSGAVGYGVILGNAFTFSRQVVVSPNGQAAFATTFTPLVGLPFNAAVTPGAGGYGGFQFSVSNAQTPQDLSDLFISGGGGGGRGWGGGGDLAVGTGTQGQLVYQFTGTVGAGGSAPTPTGFGGSFTFTTLTPICKD